MQDALYGEDGFFLRHAPAAHFRTSVTASPVSRPRVRRLAGLVDAALGRPDPFDLVDLGSGRGELLSALPDVPPRWRLTGVDLGPDPGNGLAWTATVPPTNGLLLANEWLDNVPLDVLFDGRVVEVDPDGTERLGGPGSADALAWARRWWPQGRRVEVGLGRDRAWAAAVGQVRRGLAVGVDYGHVLGDRTMYGDRRPTLTGYRDGRPVRPVPDGSCDLTAQVALDAASQRRAATCSVNEQPLRHWISRPTLRHASYRCPTGFGWLICPVGTADPLPGADARRDGLAGLR